MEGFTLSHAPQLPEVGRIQSPGIDAVFAPELPMLPGVPRPARLLRREGAANVDQPVRRRVRTACDARAGGGRRRVRADAAVRAAHAHRCTAACAPKSRGARAEP